MLPSGNGRVTQTLTAHRSGIGLTHFGIDPKDSTPRRLPYQCDIPVPTTDHFHVLGQYSRGCPNRLYKHNTVTLEQFTVYIVLFKHCWTFYHTYTFVSIPLFLFCFSLFTISRKLQTRGGSIGEKTKAQLGLPVPSRAFQACLCDLAHHCSYTGTFIPSRTYNYRSVCIIQTIFSNTTFYRPELQQ